MNELIGEVLEALGELIGEAIIMEFETIDISE
jgi:hypothetical protein